MPLVEAGHNISFYTHLICGRSMYSPVELISENNPKLFNSVHELVIERTKPIAFSKLGFKRDLPSANKLKIDSRY